ncbi:MAG: hypothetical protein HZC37_08410 [Burkholderiales bacterium]|nr:hypothetical protein [Burkholderiales bacterium]
MNNSFARLVDGTAATLRAEVLPRIDDEYARSQVWGVINLLNTLKMRADWSAGPLLQQLEAQRKALATAAEALRGEAALPTEVPDPVPHIPSADDLRAARDQGNLLIGRLLAWLAEAPPGVDAAALAAAEAALLGAMRAEVEIDLKHSPRPLFAQMSGAAEG